MNNKQWTINNGIEQSKMIHDQLTMNDKRLIMTNEQWMMNNEQGSMINNQWMMNSE